MKNLAFTLVAFLFAFSANAQEWTKWQVTYESNNEVFTAIDFYDHENGIVVGDGGAIKVTTVAGQTWTDYSNTTFGDVLGVDMHKADEIYLFNQHEVYRLSGSNLSSEVIFKNDEIDIKFCEKQIMPISTGEDAPYIYIGANDEQAFCSQSNGKKWFKVNTKRYNNDDDILFINGYYSEAIEDTGYFAIYSKVGKVLSINNFGSFEYEIPFFDGEPVSKANNCNSHSPHYTVNKFICANQKGEISLVWGNSQYDLNHTANTSLNDGVLVSEMISSLNNKNSWLGWAIGNDGYIAEYNDELIQGAYKPISSPSTKNLNVIDFASEYNETDRSKFANGTVCIAGDGVIMMCYIDWNPSTSVDFVQKEVSAVAYPNPFTGSINISLNHLESNQPLSIKVLNLQGQVLADENYNSIENKSLNTELGAHLAKGVYLLEITNDNHTQVQKIIKE